MTPRAPDVPPGLVLPRGPGTRVGPRDAATVPGGERPRVHAMRRVGVQTTARDRHPRSGYTGEVGFEVFTFQDVAHDLWSALLEEMGPYGGAPCGLAARDVLRLEMGYPLYGRTCSNRSPPSRPGCRGPSRSTRATSEGGRRCVNARKGCRAGSWACACTSATHPGPAVFTEDQLIGEVTSGTFSPLLQTGIGLAYLWPADVATTGDTVEVDIRGRRGVADVVRPPFVDRNPR